MRLICAPVSIGSWLVVSFPNSCTLRLNVTLNGLEISGVNMGKGVNLGFSLLVPS